MLRAFVLPPPYLRVLVAFALSMLHVKFAPVWEAAITLLVAISEQGEEEDEVMWPLLRDALEKSFQAVPASTSTTASTGAGAGAGTEGLRRWRGLLLRQTRPGTACPCPCTSTPPEHSPRVRPSQGPSRCRTATSSRGLVSTATGSSAIDICRL